MASMMQCVDMVLEDDLLTFGGWPNGRRPVGPDAAAAVAASARSCVLDGLHARDMTGG